MKLFLVASLIALASASAVLKDGRDFDVFIGKENLDNLPIKTKEMFIWKLLNHIMQPTMYEDIRQTAQDFIIEDNVDKFLKVEVVKDFLLMWKTGMLPRDEIFVHTNTVHMRQVVKVFRMLYFARDFDTFIRTACFLREHINAGMFVYCLTVTVFHRDDCRGIALPAPYEIYPQAFIDSTVMKKATMMKMTRGFVDPVIMKYYGLKKDDDRNLVIIDSRKDLRTAVDKEDVLRYFTEDIDLNTFYYYLHLNYPNWMVDDIYPINKERRGEIVMYTMQQLLARLRLERLGHNMCDIEMLNLRKPLKTGYWPKIHFHNGVEIPMRPKNTVIVNDYNLKYKLFIDDIEKIIRESILLGRVTLRDGRTINLKKAEDVEYLCRLVLGSIGYQNDDAKVFNLFKIFTRLLTYSTYNQDKYTYVPSVMDLYVTCLRDPVYWQLMKRVYSNIALFKGLLPVYTHEQINFEGVKVEKVVTDKLVTFMDWYDVDITNGLWLDQTEMKKKTSEKVFVARQRRLNHQPFKVSIDVVSEKAVDAVVRVFIGPKYDCMGRLLNLNDKRLDMVEIDSFIYKLDTGKNVIVRDSRQMHGVLMDRPWTRNMINRVKDITMTDELLESYWYKTRRGFPYRLLLPLGLKGGLPLQMFVIVTPVRTGLVLPSIDLTIQKTNRRCAFASCMDTMPLGFPFDRRFEVNPFFTTNVKFVDIRVFRKDLDLVNVSKDVDMSDMVMRRDDLTYLDTDMLERWTYRDVMLGVNGLTRM